MKKFWYTVLAISTAVVLVGSGFILWNIVLKGEVSSATTQAYETQGGEMIEEGTELESESYDFEATPAPEAPVYDPAVVDEGMGEEGIDRPKTSGEEQYDWLIEEYGPPIYDGWICNGPAYICRGAEAEKEREDEYNKWAEENGIPEDLEDEAEAEAEAPWTCEGSGSYGDYSPEGYEGCP